MIVDFSVEFAVKVNVTVNVMVDVEFKAEVRVGGLIAHVPVGRHRTRRARRSLAFGPMRRSVTGNAVPRSLVDVLA
jgi:hypothetical protein